MSAGTAATSAEPETAPVAPVVPMAISVRNVVRSYGDFHALDGISFDVPQGALCGLIGPNGAGKTTLLSILATLDEDFAGGVKVAGVDVKRNPGLARKRIGFVPDHTAIYDALTVTEYLQFFAAAAGIDKDKRYGAVARALAQCDLQDLSERPAGGLSKGLTQRLCVARALLHDPQVLLLDEPASGLDPRARIELKELLKRLAKQGVTVFISSHILTELGDFCDHVVLLEKGAVKAADTVSALFAEVNGKATGTAARRLVIEVLGDAARARDIAITQPAVTDAASDGAMLAVTIGASSRDIAKLIRALVEGGVDVVSVVPERQNLEALFLTLTRGGAA